MHERVFVHANATRCTRLLVPYQYTDSKPVLLYVDYVECCLTRINIMTFSLLGIGPIIGAYGNDGAPIRLISAGDPGFISCRSCIKLN